MIPANAVVEHVAGSMTPGGGAPRGFMADRRARVEVEVVEAQEPAAFLAGRA